MKSIIYILELFCLCTGAAIWIVTLCGLLMAVILWLLCPAQVHDEREKDV